MKLVLTVPALERLIGGDTEVEVELRKSIVQEFAKRHLTAVAKEVYSDIEATKALIKEHVLREMGAVKLEAWSGGKYKLTSECTAAIKVSVMDVIHDAVTAAAKEAWVEFRPQILERLAKAYEREALAVIKEQVRQDILKALGK